MPHHFETGNQIKLLLRGAMLNKDWLSTCAPLGIFDSNTKAWKAIGAGVFIYDDPYIWYVTALHLIKDKEPFSTQVLVNHTNGKHCLVDIGSLHKQHNVNWIIDNNHDLAATLFPSNPNFNLKAISKDYFFQSKDLLPSMRCYSVGCPYSLSGFDIENMTTCVLDGIISGVDSKQHRVYVTVPTFPGNSGGPIFVWKEPIQANGGLEIGDPTVYLGGIITEYALIGCETSQEMSELRLPSLHLGVVIPSEAILALLNETQAKELKNQIKKKH